jgi:hypothetical protein
VSFFPYALLALVGAGEVKATDAAGGFDDESL